MELRDVFAGFYMCGAVAALESDDDSLDYDDLASNAYLMADTMLEARDAEPDDDEDEDED